MIIYYDIQLLQNQSPPMADNFLLRNIVGVYALSQKVLNFLYLNVSLRISL